MLFAREAVSGHARQNLELAMSGLVTKQSNNVEPLQFCIRQHAAVTSQRDQWPHSSERAGVGPEYMLQHEFHSAKRAKTAAAKPS